MAWGSGAVCAITPTVARNLKAARRVAGWSQARLERESGVRRTYIAAIESARMDASLNSLVKLSEALGVDMADLFSEGPSERGGRR